MLSVLLLPSRNSLLIIQFGPLALALSLLCSFSACSRVDRRVGCFSARSLLYYLIVSDYYYYYRVPPSFCFPSSSVAFFSVKVMRVSEWVFSGTRSPKGDRGPNGMCVRGLSIGLFGNI